VGTIHRPFPPGLAHPRYPTSAGRPAYRCSLPGLAGFGGQRALVRPSSRTPPTAGPVGRGITVVPRLPRAASGTAPRASAPARRFPVTGDAEPPGLARRQVKLPEPDI